jgi:hypothetical protein
MEAPQMARPITPLSIATIRRAFRAADRDGEAALNGLLYSGGALLMSAVLLVASAPAALAMVLAMIPWVALAIGTWIWVRPAWQGAVAADRQLGLHADRVRAAAADLLLDEMTTDEDRRLAAAYLSEALDGDERARAAERLLEHRVPFRA